MRIRRSTGLVLAGLTALAVSVGLGQQAQAAGGYYEITNFGSGMCAEVDRFGGTGANGTPLVQRACDGQTVQHWLPIEDPRGVHKFINRATGKCMDLRDGRDADRTVIQQWECGPSTSMKWTINPNSFDGVHQIKSFRTGRCLDVRGGSVLNGAAIQSVHCTGFGNAAQVWFFTPKS